MESPTMDEVITLRNALRMRRLMSSPWVWVWGLPPRVPTEYELNECWKESDKVVPMYTHAEMVANHGCLCPENYKDERNEVYSCHEAQWRRGWDKETVDCLAKDKVDRISILPAELLFNIFYFLEPVTSACLGVTAKPLYAIHMSLYPCVSLLDYASASRHEICRGLCRRRQLWQLLRTWIPLNYSLCIHIHARFVGPVSALDCECAGCRTARKDWIAWVKAVWGGDGDKEVVVRQKGGRRRGMRLKKACRCKRWHLEGGFGDFVKGRPKPLARIEESLVDVKGCPSKVERYARS